jgi:hypothetical protein
LTVKTAAGLESVASTVSRLAEMEYWALVIVTVSTTESTAAKMSTRPFPKVLFGVFGEPESQLLDRICTAFH